MATWALLACLECYKDSLVCWLVLLLLLLLVLPCFHHWVCPYSLVLSLPNLITSVSATCLIGPAPFPYVFDVSVFRSQRYRFGMVVGADEGLNVL